MDAKYRFNITNGPSKMDLMFSLFDSDRRDGKTAIFEVIESNESGQRITTDFEGLRIRINGVSHEDGSGESWCFSGYIVGPSRKDLNFGRVQGWFRSSNRSGWLNVIR